MELTIDVSSISILASQLQILFIVNFGILGLPDLTDHVTKKQRTINADDITSIRSVTRDTTFIIDSDSEVIEESVNQNI